MTREFTELPGGQHYKSKEEKEEAYTKKYNN